MKTQKTFSLFSVTLLFAIFSVAGVSNVYADVLSDLEADKLRKEIEKLEAEIKEINSRLEPSESSPPDPLTLNQTQLAVDKAQLEVNALLKTQNTSPIDSFFSTTYNQSLVTTVLSAFFGLLAPTVAWYKSKKIIPFSDREKTFREIAVKRYDNLYKEKWALIKNRILDDNANPDPIQVHDIWNQIKNRKFPSEYMAGEDGITAQFRTFVEAQTDILEVLKKSNKNCDVTSDFISSLKQTAFNNFFERVKTNLPSLVGTAVTTALSKTPADYSDNYNASKRMRAYYELILLMINYELSEFEHILLTKIDLELKKQDKEATDTPPQKHDITLHLKDE